MKKSEAERSTGRPSPTRQRIIAAALQLFNERGPDHVTTAEIARAVNINEGNLYYHFRTKEALVLALFALFETDALAVVAKIDEEDEVAASTYAGFLRLWFSLVWNYRFLFRDFVGLLSSAPALVEPVRGISAAMRFAVDDIVSRMERAGLAEIPETERGPCLPISGSSRPIGRLISTFRKGSPNSGRSNWTGDFGRCPACFDPISHHWPPPSWRRCLKLIHDFT